MYEQCKVLSCCAVFAWTNSNFYSNLFTKTQNSMHVFSSMLTTLVVSHFWVQTYQFTSHFFLREHDKPNIIMLSHMVSMMKKMVFKNASSLHLLTWPTKNKTNTQAQRKKPCLSKMFRSVQKVSKTLFAQQRKFVKQSLLNNAAVQSQNKSAPSEYVKKGN